MARPKGDPSQDGRLWVFIMGELPWIGRLFGIGQFPANPMWAVDNGVYFILELRTSAISGAGRGGPGAVAATKRAGSVLCMSITMWIHPAYRKRAFPSHHPPFGTLIDHSCPNGSFCTVGEWHCSFIERGQSVFKPTRLLEIGLELLMPIYRSRLQDQACNQGRRMLLHRYTVSI